MTSVFHDLFTIKIVLGLAALLFTGGCAADAPSDFRIDAHYTVHDPQFGRAMGSLLGSSWRPGNSCTTLLNGDQIFPAMLDSIHSAKKTISFETFIFLSGTIGKEFTDALSERAKAGVKVHMMVDYAGSSPIDNSFVKQLKSSGVSFREYHPFHLWNPATYAHADNRTHRKLLIVDGRVGFTGGIGISDEWGGHAQDPRHWHNNHYKIEGPVVTQLQAAFMDNWIDATGEVLVGDDYFPPLPSAGSLWAQVFMSSAEGGSESMQLMMLLAFASAGDHIRMESAYFIPDAITRRYLIAARKRGVSIEVIVPGRHIDEKIVRNASRALWGDLLKAGIGIYEYQPTMFHCKQMIVDDLWVSVGSANMDNRSFRRNDEANLNVLDQKFAAEQIAVFEEDKHHARRISLEEWEQRPFGEKLAEVFASLLDWEL